MNRLTRISATVASSACLVAGFAGVAGAAPSITDNGNDSASSVTTTNRTRTRVTNHTRVRVVSNNPQTAISGDVLVDGNRDTEDQTSGAASNSSDTMGTANVSYSAATAAALDAAGSGAAPTESDATIEGNGNNSDNVVKTTNRVRTTVSNRSNARVTSNNSQTAISGNVTATDNRDVGSLTSGDASNDSLTTLEVNITY